MASTGLRASWSEAAPAAYTQSPESAEEFAREPAEAFSVGQQARQRNSKSVKVRRSAAATAAMPPAPAVGRTDLPSAAPAPAQQAQASAPAPIPSASAPFMFGTPGKKLLRSPLQQDFLCCWQLLSGAIGVCNLTKQLVTCIPLASACVQEQGLPAAQSKCDATGAARLALCRLPALHSLPAVPLAWRGAPSPRPQPVSEPCLQGCLAPARGSAERTAAGTLDCP